MVAMWSVVSALFVLGLWGTQVLPGSRGVAFTVWQWVAYVVWLLWTLAGVVLVWTFAGEREARPARVTLLLFGVPSITVAIALVSLFGLI